MLSIKRIDKTDNIYTNNNKISFKSKFVPNKFLYNVFDIMEKPEIPLYEAKSFVNIVENILNDGKNDIVEFTTNNRCGLGYKINGKKQKFKKDSAESSDIINNAKTITKDEFNIIQNALNKLNADLNADDIRKNPVIMENLNNNIAEIERILREYTINKLNNLKNMIFNGSK